ncbi:MAG: TIGR03084 family metal-binding protein [Pseudomonadota bacterium]
MQQALDFRAESEALDLLLSSCNDATFARPTQFKNWSIGDIIGHLHMFNFAARLSLEAPHEFPAFAKPVHKGLVAGRSMMDMQAEWLDGLSGSRLFDTWRLEYLKTADAFAHIDPKARLKWIGPDMSARSSITARQMETWAHGQAVFDVLGTVRQDTDRIRNIAHLGVATFGWTFTNRRQPVPDPMPFVALTAPSGAIWTRGEDQEKDRVSGSAVGFCQIVAQTRNVADTDIVAVGDTARHWMKIAQCFAGPPHDPPRAGQRFMATK